jgi:hypothetical protein
VGTKSLSKSKTVTDLHVPLEQRVEHYMALGYPKQIVKDAINATMAPVVKEWGLAAMVMERLLAGKGIPPDQPKVWTTQDDSDLRFVMDVQGKKDVGSGAVERARRARAWLERKHGVTSVKTRIVFLGR